MMDRDLRPRQSRRQSPRRAYRRKTITATAERTPRPVSLIALPSFVTFKSPDKCPNQSEPVIGYRHDKGNVKGQSRARSNKGQKFAHGSSINLFPSRIQATRTG
jgi:hypothetical protein